MPKNAERCCAGSNYVVVRWIVARHIATTQIECRAAAIAIEPTSVLTLHESVGNHRDLTFGSPS